MKFKRILGLVLAVLMVMSTFSVGAFAEEQTQQQTDTSDLTPSDGRDVVVPNMPEMPAGALTGDFAEKNDLQWTFDAEKGLLVIHGTDTVLEMDTVLDWDIAPNLLPWGYNKLTINPGAIKEVIIAAPIEKIESYVLSNIYGVKKITIPTTLTDLSAAGALAYCYNLTTIVVAGNEEVEGTLDLSCVTKIGGFTFAESCGSNTVKVLTGDIEEFDASAFFKDATLEIMLKSGTPLDEWATRYKSGEFASNSNICKNITFTYYEEEGGDEPNPDEPNPDEPDPDEPNPDEPNPDEPNPDEPNAVIPDMPEMPAGALTGDFAEKNDLQWTFDAEKGLLVIHGTDTVLEMDTVLDWDIAPNLLPWGYNKLTINPGAIKEVIIAAPIEKIESYVLSNIYGVKKITIPTTLTDLSAAGALAYCYNLTTIVVAGNEEVEGTLDLSCVTKIGALTFDASCGSNSVKVLTGDIEEFDASAFFNDATLEIMLKPGTPLDEWATRYKSGEFASNSPQICKKITFTYYEEEGGDEPDPDEPNPDEPNPDEPDPEEPTPDEPNVVIPDMPEMPEGALTGDFAEKNDLQWTFDAEKGLLVIHGTDTVLEMDSNVNWSNSATLLPWGWQNNTISSVAIKEIIIAAPIEKIANYMLSDLYSVTKITIPTTLTDLSAECIFTNCNNLTTITVAGNEEVEGTIDLSNVTKIGGFALSGAFGQNTVKILTGDIVAFDANEFIKNATAEIMIKPGTPLDAWAARYNNGEFAGNSNISKNITFTYYSNYVVGDVNSDGEVNISDVVRLAQYLADWPVDIDEAAANCDGEDGIKIGDVVRLAQYLADWPVELVG